MALQKTKVAASGASGNYFRVDAVVVGHTAAQGSIAVVNFYVDQAAATAPRKAPLEGPIKYELPESCITLTKQNSANSNARKLAYDWIKANDSFFSDASDV